MPRGHQANDWLIHRSFSSKLKLNNSIFSCRFGSQSKIVEIRNFDIICCYYRVPPERGLYLLRTNPRVSLLVDAVCASSLFSLSICFLFFSVFSRLTDCLFICLLIYYLLDSLPSNSPPISSLMWSKSNECQVFSRICRLQSPPIG